MFKWFWTIFSLGAPVTVLEHESSALNLFFFGDKLLNSLTSASYKSKFGRLL